MMRMLFSVTLVAGLSVAASLSLAQNNNFQGTWKVKSTSGQPFEIVLSADGSAKGTLRNDMTGTWKEDGGQAVITWKTGWTTKIAKQANRYTKTAYRNGQTSPANSSEAEKVK